MTCDSTQRYNTDVHRIQSTLDISNTCYLELLLSGISLSRTLKAFDARYIGYPLSRTFDIDIFVGPLRVRDVKRRLYTRISNAESVLHFLNAWPHVISCSAEYL